MDSKLPSLAGVEKNSTGVLVMDSAGEGQNLGQVQGELPLAGEGYAGGVKEFSGEAMDRPDEDFFKDMLRNRANADSEPSSSNQVPVLTFRGNGPIEHIVISSKHQEILFFGAPETWLTLDADPSPVDFSGSVPVEAPIQTRTNVRWGEDVVDAKFVPFLNLVREKFPDIFQNFQCSIPALRTIVLEVLGHAVKKLDENTVGNLLQHGPPLSSKASAGLF